jgi:hypothetical protein
MAYLDFPFTLIFKVPLLGKIIITITTAVSPLNIYFGNKN